MKLYHAGKEEAEYQDQFAAYMQKLNDPKM